jgi:membrane-associated phospholipid phosphatase
MTREPPDDGLGERVDAHADERVADRYVGRQDLLAWHSRAGRALAGAASGVAGRLGAQPALVLTLALGILIAAAASFLASEVYEAVLERDDIAGLDRPALRLALSWRSPTLDGALTAYTNLAGTIGMPVLATLFLLALTIRRRSRTPAILIAAAAAGSLLMTIAGKELTGRARPALADAVPPFEHSPSFPSGHTLNATVIVGVIAYLLLLRQRRVRARTTTIVVASVFIVTIGLSRVYLGHHWLTDVVAAWLLGLAWLAVVITTHRLYLTARARGAAELGPLDARRRGSRADAHGHAHGHAGRGRRDPADSERD